MDVDKPISELVDLLARRSPPANPLEILRDLQQELEILIGRHQIEGASQAAGVFESGQSQSWEGEFQ